MKKTLAILAALAALAATAFGCGPNEEFTALEQQVDQQATAIALLTTPVPTATPQPMPTPPPTPTPQPEPTPQPTATPAPTATPQTIPLRVPLSAWVDDRMTGASYSLTTLGASEGIGTSTLYMACLDYDPFDNTVVIYVGSAFGLPLFSDAAPGDQTDVTLHAANFTDTRVWTLTDAGDQLFMGGSGASSLINRLRRVDDLVVEIATADDPYKIYFELAGLDSLIDSSSHLCRKINQQSEPRVYRLGA